MVRIRTNGRGATAVACGAANGDLRDGGLSKSKAI